VNLEGRTKRESSAAIPRCIVGKYLIFPHFLEAQYLAKVGVEGSNPFARSNTSNIQPGVSSPDILPTHGNDFGIGNPDGRRLSLLGPKHRQVPRLVRRLSRQ
jgi:hypothetical protein